MKAPSEADARAFTAAITQGFGPCDCHPHGDVWHLCAGHEWLRSDPTCRQRVKVWQRLLFMRAQRAALLFEEGVARPIPGLDPAPAPTRLPW